MKSTLLIFLSVFSLSVFAQSSEIEIPEDDDAATLSAEMPETPAVTPVSAKGLRAGVWFPNLNTKDGNSSARRIDRTVGVTVGYASLPIRRLGWIANAGLYELTEYERAVNSNSKEDAATLAKFDLNLAFALTSNFYVKAGGNISGFTQEDMREDLEPGLGYQAGLGVQLTSHIGFEAGWLNTTQYGVGEREGEDFNADGVDFGITGTF